MGVPQHSYIDKDNPTVNNECGDDLVSTRPASSGSECSSSDTEYAAVYRECDCIGDYKEVPHNMGRSQPPVFTKRPPKGKLRFSSTIVKHVERVNSGSLWDEVTADMIDHSDLPKVRSDKKKTKRKGISRTTFPKEVPVENDRDSTIHLFLGRCCAAFSTFSS